MFKLFVATDGAAFAGADDDYGAGPEVARILREVADKIDVAGIDRRHGLLHDFNGNTVGGYELSASPGTVGTGSHRFYLGCHLTFVTDHDGKVTDLEIMPYQETPSPDDPEDSERAAEICDMADALGWEFDALDQLPAGITWEV